MVNTPSLATALVQVFIDLPDRLPDQSPCLYSFPASNLAATLWFLITALLKIFQWLLSPYGRVYSPYEACEVLSPFTV